MQTQIPDHVPPELIQEYNPAFDPDMAKNPFRTLSELHKGPDIFYSPAGPLNRTNSPGNWIVTRADLMREVLQDAETFSSVQCAGFSALIGEQWNMVPLEVDPPKHPKFRMLLNPLFSPKAVDALEKKIRKQCTELLDNLKDKGECAFLKDFGTPFPVTVVLQLLDLPLEQLDQFLKWEDDLLHVPDMATKQKAAKAIRDYLVNLIDERKKNPGDDLISFVAQAKIDGEPISDDEMLGFCYLFFVGGLDTVAATLGYTFRYLATHKDTRKQLTDQPELIPNFIEEMMRLHSVVTTRRQLTKDINFHGVEMKKGEWVECVFALASLDPKEFKNPLEMHIDREPNRHLAFSAGPHRCIGSHLARREMVIAIEEWLKRIPDFHIKEGTQIKNHSGVFGLDHLPLEW